MCDIKCIIHTFQGKNTVFRTDVDGFYMLIVEIDSNTPFKVQVEISMKGTYGYLSAADWPLLPVSTIFNLLI